MQGISGAVPTATGREDGTERDCGSGPVPLNQRMSLSILRRNGVMEAQYHPLFSKAALAAFTAPSTTARGVGACLLLSTFLAVMLLTMQFHEHLALRAWHLDSLTYSDPAANDTQAEQIRLIIPSYNGHLEEFVHFMKSLACLCTDIDEIPISAVLSNQAEIELFQARLQAQSPCGSNFLNYNTSHVANNTHPRQLVLENLYDILPPPLSNMTGLNHTTRDTVGVLQKHGLYKYQSIKKLAAAARHDFDYALWLDSEGLAIRPFSMRETIRAYYRDPVIWKSAMTDERQTDFMRAIMDASAGMIGRTMEEFGRRYWNVESFMWPIEKVVINDLLALRLASAPQQNYWDRLLKTPGLPFEICVYNLFIHLRKEDTAGDPVYDKYRILQVEREVEKFNLTTALEQVSHQPGTGLLERFYLLLREPGALADVVHFTKFNRLYFQRMDDRGFTDKETILKFLRDASVAMILSSNPGIDDWIAEAQLDISGGGWKWINATAH
ncbi:hypothetical protein BP5796_09760 [Coleophoma crateriformis]|uniref:Uncharacterized protein n=1 Tax=Coleophoma crateriformis TaxID=565419 RepID=A0A3D8QZC3_9HELO|nr:hypothetical protein BP5796_09760 [Coleophoma crateriformis]